MIEVHNEKDLRPWTTVIGSMSRRVELNKIEAIVDANCHALAYAEYGALSWEGEQA